jgi:DNA-binding transcriptional ArsR family regulator
MNTNQVARVAALVGEPARTGMLLALMDGRALTAGELAGAARVSAATASRHLSLLLEGGLLHVHQQGRHRYHRLATPEVARMLEGIMQLAAAQAPAPPRTGPQEEALRFARTCYDHLAGRLAVAMAEHLVETRALVVDDDTAVLTGRASLVLGGLGLDGAALPKTREGQRPACRLCLDWGERRMHIAGQLGHLLCAHSLDQGWLLRKSGSRALELTPGGARAFRDWLGLERWQAVAESRQD